MGFLLDVVEKTRLDSGNRNLSQEGSCAWWGILRESDWVYLNFFAELVS